MAEFEIPWLSYLKEGDEVTTELPYKEGTYLDLFEDHLYETHDEKVGAIRYYVYDPTKHGFSADDTYPVILAFHGAGASLNGKIAVNWAGVEYFASEEYQKKMGGAYIICPIANEVAGEHGTDLTWMTPVSDEVCLDGYDEEELRIFDENAGSRAAHMKNLLGKNSVYTKYLNEIYNLTVKTFTSAGKTIVLGTSAGGFCAWRYIISYKVDAAILMTAAYLPSKKDLDKLENDGTKLWICNGIHDELVNYNMMIQPILHLVENKENIELFFPEFVRMPNKKVYSNPAGIEMGQHCINNALQCDFMFDDGTSMDPNHPMGVTGYIRSFK